MKSDGELPHIHPDSGKVQRLQNWQNVCSFNGFVAERDWRTVQNLPNEVELGIITSLLNSDGISDDQSIN